MTTGHGKARDDGQRGRHVSPEGGKGQGAGSSSASPREGAPDLSKANLLKNAMRAQSADLKSSTKKRQTAATISSAGQTLDKAGGKGQPGGAGAPNVEASPSPSADLTKVTRRKRNKLPYQEKLEDAPENKEGLRI